MVKDRNQLIELLKESYPMVKLRTTEEFNGNKGGLWVTSTEDHEEDSDGITLFDYYAVSHDIYEFGVVKHLSEFVQKHGWFFEWNDAGTIMIWKI